MMEYKVNICLFYFPMVNIKKFFADNSKHLKNQTGFFIPIEQFD